ncbi:MAG: metalloregulator ArsR/SmtB family transcription factor [bacterium]|nr:metalloregulator ArsR/SmtB family transcription factor [bacterium]
MERKCCEDNKLTEEYANLAKFLRIVGDDNRLRILCLLKGGEKCVCEISPTLNMAQNLTSSHLKVMLDFGLVNLRQDWNRNYYSINRPMFKKYNFLIKIFLKNYE